MSIKRPFSYEEFKQIYSKVPRLCVDIVIQTDNGILLTERALKSWRNMWHLPGGTVYYKEHLYDAVKRIAKEEIQVEIMIKKFLGYMEFPSEEKERGFGWSVSLAFLCAIVSGEPSVDEQASSFGFFTTLPSRTVPEHKEFLMKFLKDTSKKKLSKTN